MYAILENDNYRVLFSKTTKEPRIPVLLHQYKNTKGYWTFLEYNTTTEDEKTAQPIIDKDQVWAAFYDKNDDKYYQVIQHENNVYRRSINKENENEWVYEKLDITSSPPSWKKDSNTDGDIEGLFLSKKLENDCIEWSRNIKDRLSFPLLDQKNHLYIEEEIIHLFKYSGISVKPKEHSHDWTKDLSKNENGTNIYVLPACISTHNSFFTMRNYESYFLRETLEFIYSQFSMHYDEIIKIYSSEASTIENTNTKEELYKKFFSRSFVLPLEVGNHWIPVLVKCDEIDVTQIETLLNELFKLGEDKLNDSNIESIITEQDVKNLNAKTIIQTLQKIYNNVEVKWIDSTESSYYENNKKSFEKALDKAFHSIKDKEHIHQTPLKQSDGTSCGLITNAHAIHFLKHGSFLKKLKFSDVKNFIRSLRISQYFMSEHTGSPILNAEAKNEFIDKSGIYYQMITFSNPTSRGVTDVRRTINTEKQWIYEFKIHNNQTQWKTLPLKRHDHYALYFEKLGLENTYENWNIRIKNNAKKIDEKTYQYIEFRFADPTGVIAIRRYVSNGQWIYNFKINDNCNWYTLENTSLDEFDYHTYFTNYSCFEHDTNTWDTKFNPSAAITNTKDTNSASLLDEDKEEKLFSNLDALIFQSLKKKQDDTKSKETSGNVEKEKPVIYGDLDKDEDEGNPFNGIEALFSESKSESTNVVVIETETGTKKNTDTEETPTPSSYSLFKVPKVGNFLSGITSLFNSRNNTTQEEANEETSKTENPTIEETSTSSSTTKEVYIDDEGETRSNSISSETIVEENKKKPVFTEEAPRNTKSSNTLTEKENVKTTTPRKHIKQTLSLKEKAVRAYISKLATDIKEEKEETKKTNLAAVLKKVMDTKVSPENKEKLLKSTEKYGLNPIFAEEADTPEQLIVIIEEKLPTEKQQLEKRKKATNNYNRREKYYGTLFKEENGEEEFKNAVLIEREIVSDEKNHTKKDETYRILTEDPDTATQLFIETLEEKNLKYTEQDDDGQCIITVEGLSDSTLTNDFITTYEAKLTAAGKNVSQSTKDSENDSAHVSAPSAG